MIQEFLFTISDLQYDIGGVLLILELLFTISDVLFISMMSYIYTLKCCRNDNGILTHLAGQMSRNATGAPIYILYIYQTSDMIWEVSYLILELLFTHRTSNMVWEVSYMVYETSYLLYQMCSL